VLYKWTSPPAETRQTDARARSTDDLLCLSVSRDALPYDAAFRYQLSEPVSPPRQPAAPERSYTTVPAHQASDPPPSQLVAVSRYLTETWRGMSG
jgi:hypothetical protein